MSLPATISVGVVAAIHAYILVLESFLWTTPRGRKAFGLNATFAEKTKALAQNQGLYNGFLATGLVWGLVHPNAEFAKQIQLYFLGCVGVAGVVGAATTGKSKIAFIQTLPASVAVALVLFA